MSQMWTIGTALAGLQRAILLVFALLVLPLLMGFQAAHAAGCSGGDEAAALKRQAAALNGLYAQRGCRGASLLGGFFNACGDISRRKAAVQQQLAAVSARLDPACRANRQQARAADRSRERQSTPGWVGANSMLFCVRLSDGYYFPVPGSQFVRSGDASLSLDQCRYICRGAEVDVYKLGSPAQETEEMTSVETGRPYSELPKAFAYREDPNFRKCDFDGYVRRVEEARARTVTPTDMKNALIPVPAMRPAVRALDAQATSSTTEQTTALLEEDSRSVRVVGPNFFPE